MDAHAGAAEGERAFVFALGNFRTNAKADAVEHILGVVVVGRFHAHVLDFPALGLEVRYDDLLERITGEIRAHDQLFVLDHLHEKHILSIIVARFGAIFFALYGAFSR